MDVASHPADPDAPRVRRHPVFGKRDLFWATALAILAGSTVGAIVVAISSLFT